MLITIPQTLTVTEVFNLGQFGEVSLSANGRLFNPTNIIDPNDTNAAGTSSSGTSNIAAVTAQQNLNNRSRIILDDGSSASNLSDVPYVNTTDADPTNDTLRIGSTTTGLTGVLGFGFNNYRIQPTQAPVFNYEARPALPEVGGGLKVSSFNVLNYFNGDGAGGGFPTSRGADTAIEFGRQRAKIITAIKELNADVVGLIEMENDGDGANSAIVDLVNGLNTAIGSNTYDYIKLANTSGSSGTDEIKVAFIYKPGAVTPVGNDDVISIGEPATEDRNDTSLYAPNQFRSSDHDPVLVGLDLKPTGGTTGADRQVGTDGNDTLFGNAGNDIINGGAGNDFIIGGLGVDLLFGGAGNDTFVYYGANEGIDKINDFAVEFDRISISGTGFGGATVVGDVGVLDAARFTLGSSATNTSQRFIYNNTSGALFFDADGVGGTAQVRIAQLVGNPALTNASFSIF